MKKYMLVAIVLYAWVGVPMAAADSKFLEEFSVDGFTYKVLNEKTVEVDGSKPNTEKIVIPATVNHGGVTYAVTSIGGAFFKCSALTSITIPSSVTSIGNYAFYGCTSLSSISIPSSVTTIGQQAFWGCTSLASITLPSSVTSIGSSIFSRCSSLTSITIPSSATSIGDAAFSGCASLTSITIPSSVTTIGLGAFNGCSSLTSIAIPSSVTSIGISAFWGCTALKKYIVDKGNSNYASLDGVLFDKDGTTLIAYPSKKSSRYVIPLSVTSIGELAFRSCTALSSIRIPPSVTSIGEGAFLRCSSLTSITIPSSVTAIGDDAFAGSGLLEIHCEQKVPLPITSNTFNGVGKDRCKLYVPKGSSNLYAKAPVWGEFASISEE